MVSNYGELVKAARAAQSPPMSAKELADYLKVKPPFITDIEKGRRLPSLENQKKIKEKLVCDQYGNPSTFSISAEEQEMGTELKVTLLQPCEGLSKQGKE